MPATARMILQVEPAEKARWTDAARKAGISTAEYLRRAAAVFDPDISPAEIEMIGALVQEGNASLDRSLAGLDAMIATLAELNDPEREVRVRARIMAELEANPPQFDFSMFRRAAA